jgi:hypothetical protein
MSVVDFPVAPEHDESAVVPIVEFQNDPVQDGLPEVDRTSGTAEETEYDLVALFEAEPIRPPPW